MFVKKLVLGVVLGVGGVGLGVGAWFAAPLLAAADDKPDAKADKEKLRGVWKVVSAKKAGNDLGDQIGVTVKFDGDEFTMPEGDQAELKLDPTKQPKQIDVVPLNGKGKGKTLSGVYKLDGDNLTLHFGLDGQERPAGFEASGETVLLVLERVKK